MVIIFLIQGFRLFNSLIDMTWTYEFGHDIMILKMAIFNKVDCIEIEPTRHCGVKQTVFSSYTILA